MDTLDSTKSKENKKKHEEYCLKTPVTSRANVTFYVVLNNYILLFWSSVISINLIILNYYSYKFP